MAQYIDKDALVAEIKKIRAKWFGINNDFAGGQKGALTNILSLIDTLEVKEVGVDVGSPEGDLCRKTVQVIDADGNISDVTFNKAQKGEKV